VTPTPAGKLVHRVAHYRPTASAGPEGEPTETLAKLGTYWAWVRPMSQTETVYDGVQNRAVRTHDIVMRYRDVQAGDQLIYKGRTLNVNSVLNIEEADVELLVSASEVG
jgi:SPP1 family predicted phage head-tail adaptor